LGEILRRGGYEGSGERVTGDGASGGRGGGVGGGRSW
jgi:hypothetical protein